MTEAQLSATQIPVNNLIDMLAAIGNCNYSRFQKIENAFGSQHSQKAWQEVFNFWLLSSLDKPASQWLLVQWISDGTNNIKTVG